MKKELMGNEAEIWINENLTNIQKRIIQVAFAEMTHKHSTKYYAQTAYHCTLKYDVTNRKPVLTVEE